MKVLVTLEFLYDYEKEQGEDDEYYKQLVFDELYNSDDTIDTSDAVVKYIGKRKVKKK